VLWGFGIVDSINEASIPALPKPVFVVPEEPAEDAPNAFTVLFRMPNGTRVNRRFFGNATIQVAVSSHCLVELMSLQL
jgi:hypothetical protein